MNIKKLASSVASLLVTFVLLSAAGAPAHAATCSAADRKFFKTYMNAYSNAAGINGSMNPSRMFSTAKNAANGSKSPRLRSEWKKILTAMDREISGFPYEWIRVSSKVGQGIERIDGIISYKRC